MSKAQQIRRLEQDVRILNLELSYIREDVKVLKDKLQVDLEVPEDKSELAPHPPTMFSAVTGPFGKKVYLMTDYTWKYGP